MTVPRENRKVVCCEAGDSGDKQARYALMFTIPEERCLIHLSLE